MAVKVGYSTKDNIADLSADIKNQLGDFDAKVILYFASSIFNPDELAKNIQNTFSSAKTFGCSTAGEIVSGKMLKKSVVFMGFDSNVIEDFSIEILENIKDKNPTKDVISNFEKYFNTPILSLDSKKHFGMILFDGLSGAEEKIMNTLGDLVDIPIVGGSAGDDLQFKSTYIYANGKAYNNAGLIAIFKSKVPFDIIKTQSFCSLKKKLLANKVIEEKREVIEFNNKPAAVAYAEALGVDVNKASNLFMHNPVGLVVEGEPFVRSPQQFKDNSIVFYCNIKENMEVDILESMDIVKDTKASIDNKIKELGSISAIINFHCILRTLELEEKKQTEDYGKIFSNIPTIGFSTYGEEYIGHINQTSTMIVLK